MNVFYYILLISNIIGLFYTMFANSIYLFQLISAAIGLPRYLKTLLPSARQRFSTSQNTIPVSLLVPAYNEETNVVDNVKSLLDLEYPEYEIIVVNDGSKDNTLQVLLDAFQLKPVVQTIASHIPTKTVRKTYRNPDFPNLVVVDKENGGKADALNVGINLSQYPVFISIDADSLLQKDSLIRITMPFVKDKRVVGVGGMINIESGIEMVDGEIRKVHLSYNPLVNMQTVEYLRAFITGRMSFSTAGVLLIISGAFGAFDKQTVIDVGGYTVGTIGEDMELVIKLHRYLREKKSNYLIQFLPDPVCWTQPPESLRDLHNQRKRWQTGLISGLLMHKKMIFNPKYGQIGMVAIPYYWIFEVLGPFFEILGYITVPLSFLFDLVDLNFLFAFFSASVLYSIVLSIGALALQQSTIKTYTSIKQLFVLFFFCIIDSFGYHQVITFFRIKAMLTYRKNKHNWGSIKRKAFKQKNPDT